MKKLVFIICGILMMNLSYGQQYGIINNSESRNTGRGAASSITGNDCRISKDYDKRMIKNR